MSNFQISNSIEKISFKPSSQTKKLFVTMRENNKINSKDLQTFLNSICKDLNITPPKVLLQGKQPIYRDGIVAGRYYPYKKIIIYKKSPTTGRNIKNKSVLSHLLHELMHHLDYKVLKLDGALHCLGFYKRIDNLKKTLLK